MSMHVVHIEDESHFRTILGAAFQAAEPDILLRQFANGDEAFPYIQSNAKHIDLFVLDIRLPGSMSGVQIAQKIRELNCPGHIVFTSAYGNLPQETLTQVRAEFYQKPAHLMNLTEKLIQYRLNPVSATVLQDTEVDTSFSEVTIKRRPASLSHLADLVDMNDSPTLRRPINRIVLNAVKEGLTCAACGKSRRADENVCSHCGAIVNKENQEGTQPFARPPAAASPKHWSTGEAELASDQAVVLEVARKQFALPAHESVMLGRLAEVSPEEAVCALDLTPYGATEQGVSTRHLKLLRKGDRLYAMDLDSMNGSFINGHKLVPNQARLLRNGDELQLGTLTLNIRFKDHRVIKLMA